MAVACQTSLAGALEPIHDLEIVNRTPGPPKCAKGSRIPLGEIVNRPGWDWHEIVESKHCMMPVGDPVIEYHQSTNVNLGSTVENYELAMREEIGSIIPGTGGSVLPSTGDDLEQIGHVSSICHSLAPGLAASACVKSAPVQVSRVSGSGLSVARVSCGSSSVMSCAASSPDLRSGVLSGGRVSGGGLSGGRVSCGSSSVGRVSCGSSSVGRVSYGSSSVPDSKMSCSPASATLENAPSPGPNYSVEEQIGEGGYSTVHRVRHRTTDKIYAMKMCKNSSSASREIQLMQAMNNPHVMSCFEVVNGRNVVMDCMDCDLNSVIKDRSILLTEIHVQAIAVQIMRGITAIHQQGYMHRDITPANVLVNSSMGVVKLADFGIARTLGGRRLTQVCTTHPYRAPEGLHGSRNYTQAIDIWSAGCVIGEMLERRQLFPGHGDIDMLERVLRSLGNPTEKTFERLWLARAVKTPWLDVCKSSWLAKCADSSAIARLVPSASHVAHQLLRRLLQLDPSQRPSAEKALIDTFFSSAELETFDLSSLPFVRRVAEHESLEF